MRLISPRETLSWLRALWNHSRHSHWSRERLIQQQRRKFRDLVVLAYERSAFYRELIDERDIDIDVCEPDDFPVLTKTDVIEHFDRIVTDARISRERITNFLARSTDPDELFEGQFHVLHTSGTSGTVGYFVFSHDDWIKGASHIVRSSPLRWRKRIAFVAAVRGHFAGASLMLTGNHGTNNLFYNVRTYDVNQPMAEIIEQLNEFQPHTLSGYAAVLNVLAEAADRGELQIHPLQIGNGGEPLLPELKARLERSFGVPVLNAYASSEHLYMGLTFPDSDGMYLLEDDLIFELHDDHTCVTNLFNTTMPLIRYRMDDVLVPDGNGWNGYPFQRIKEVVGRYEDALVFTNRYGLEDFIHPIVIVELIVKGLHSWQVVLLDRTSFLIRARFESGMSDAEKQTTRDRIRERLGAILAQKEMDNVSFEIEEVDALAIDPHSGKFRLVVRASTTMGEIAPATALHASEMSATVTATF